MQILEHRLQRCEVEPAGAILADTEVAARNLATEGRALEVEESGGAFQIGQQEVMENLGRHELNALDRCHHLYELKQVWERMYPQAKHGGDHGNQYTGGKWQTLPLGADAPKVFGFSEAVAEKIDLSPRTIRGAVKIWKGLAPQTRARLSGTDLATKQTELKALSEIQTPAKQAKVLDLILGDVHPIHNVAQALEFLDSGKVPSAIEKAFVKVSATLAALDDEAFEGVILANEDRVIASLKRRGRI